MDERLVPTDRRASEIMKHYVAPVPTVDPELQSIIDSQAKFDREMEELYQGLEVGVRPVIPEDTSRDADRIASLSKAIHDADRFSVGQRRGMAALLSDLQCRAAGLPYRSRP